MQGCCKNNDECDCSCHTSNGTIMHCIACCYQCPFCEKNITRYAYDKHKKECNSKKIGIVGSRDFNDYKFMRVTLDKIIFGKATVFGKPVYNCSKIISGGAIGADRFAAYYAKENNIELEEFLPDWERYGKSAGFKRNRLIVDNSDIIIAFWDGKSKGTKNTLSIAKEQNKTTLIYWPN